MWEERGYTAYNGKVEMDPRSPKCWAINQPDYDREEPSYSPTSPSYNVREERGITPTYSPPASAALCDPWGCGSPRPSYSPMSRSVSPRPSGSAIADLLHARATGRYSPTAPTYSQTSADVGTPSYSPQPINKEKEPKADHAKKQKAAEEAPRQIVTRAVRSQKNAEPHRCRDRTLEQAQG